MTDEATCGKGIAEHSALPLKLAELTAALAKILELHQSSLDLSDANGRAERDAYERLATDFAAISKMLEATGRQMRGYRDLPMANHDEAVLSSPVHMEAYESFVRIERELASLLQSDASAPENA